MGFESLENSELGKQSSGSHYYDKSLLYPIKRAMQREHLAASDSLTFFGADIWTAFEVSWLTPKGKPQVCVLSISIPADSDNIIESKSLKLYLNSFNQHKVADLDTLITTITTDLSQVAGSDVLVKAQSEEALCEAGINHFDGTCLDTLDIEISSYQPDASILTTETENVSETLFSHLFKSNCPVTGQPDWASIRIRYEGKKLNHESLLAYLISYRSHQGFHEWCVEQIYADIHALIKPTRLEVYARFTRRGGLDINPIRSSHPIDLDNNTRLFRQ